MTGIPVLRPGPPHSGARGILFAILLAAGVTAGLAGGMTAGAGAARATSTSPETALPAVLSAADADRYHRIFAYQDTGRWKEARALVQKLENKILVGHVLFQRYMYPDSRKYRAKYNELKGWLGKYADHPRAKQVWKLARRRGPNSGLQRPQPPRGLGLAVRAGNDALAAKVRRSRRLTQIEIRVRSMVYRERPTQALNYIRKHRKKIRPLTYDRARAVIVRGYYHAEKDRAALAIAATAIRRSGLAVSSAFWWGGLAAWRSNNYALAARYFKDLAEASETSSWLRSAAAYWAARAYLRNHKPDRVNAMLRLAAAKPRTFYGILALRTLGEKPVFNWTLPELKGEQIRMLLGLPAVQRALALLEAGRYRWAEAELVQLVGSAGSKLKAALLALAVHNEIAGLQYRIALRSGATKPASDATLYPVPHWQPKGGFTIDRALVYALIRQESAFKTNARSHAGACGVMQLLPSSAHFIAGKRMPRSQRNCRALSLMEPEANMQLGQKYLHHLFKFPGVESNLLYTIIAYNGGPGNLRRWRKRTDYQNDPLLFIESVPARESRNHVERVLTNLWIYRYRLAEPAPSLDTLAAGGWPVYESVGGTTAIRDEANGKSGRAN